jgi:hypothetical protein
MLKGKQGRFRQNLLGTATASADELRHAVQTDHAAATENWSQEGPPQGRRS